MNQSFVVANGSATTPATYAVMFDGDYDVQVSVPAGSATISQDPARTVSGTINQTSVLGGIYYLTVENSAAFPVLSGENWYVACAISTLVQFVLTPIE